METHADPHIVEDPCKCEPPQICNKCGDGLRCWYSSRNLCTRCFKRIPAPFLRWNAATSKWARIEPVMKAYMMSHTVPGYGPRIFVPYMHATVSIRNRLKTLSTWGGPDKNTGLCEGWEFSPEALNEAVSYLQGYGFQVEEVSEANHAEVWA